jgi:cytochrome bd-type quinol oxidase subunit 2
MGPWESALGFVQASGILGVLAALLVFTLAYFLLVNVVRKYAEREPKKYEKVAFFVLSILLAALIIIFSLGEGASLVLTYVSMAIFLVALFLLVMILMLSFFGKTDWKFWRIK